MTPCMLILRYLPVSKLSPSSHVGIPISRTSQTRLTRLPTLHACQVMSSTPNTACHNTPCCLRIHLHVPRTADRPNALASQPVTPASPHAIHMHHPTYIPPCMSDTYSSFHDIPSIRARIIPLPALPVVPSTTRYIHVAQP